MILNMMAYHTALNVTVAGAAVQPSAPSENTLWVTTSDPASRWLFSASEPETPDAGMVWFTLGNSDGLTFDAVKKGGIQLCVTGCKQYLSGVWQEKTVRLWRNDAWQELEA